MIPSLGSEPPSPQRMSSSRRTGRCCAAWPQMESLRAMYDNDDYNDDENDNDIGKRLRLLVQWTRSSQPLAEMQRRRVAKIAALEWRTYAHTHKPNTWAPGRLIGAEMRDIAHPTSRVHPGHQSQSVPAQAGQPAAAARPAHRLLCPYLRQRPMPVQ
jgi:hypothetical protein